jgi:F-actin capping protein alpha subunit
VDHLAAEAVPGSTQADAPQGATEPLRAALEAALKAYREGQFAASACSSAAFAVGADTFVLYVSGEQLNLRNWWSGSWVGRYEVPQLVQSNMFRKLYTSQVFACTL